MTVWASAWMGKAGRRRSWTNAGVADLERTQRISGYMMRWQAGEERERRGLHSEGPAAGKELLA